MGIVQAVSAVSWVPSGSCGPQPSRTGPALVREAVVACVGEDEMVEQGDAKQVGALPESAGEHAILLAGGGITGGVIVGANPGAGIHQDQGFEDFARMHDGHCEGADRDEIDPDDAVLRIQPADQELLAVQSRKERSEDICSSDRSGQRRRRRDGPVVADERDLVSRHAVLIARLRLPWPMQHAV